MRGTRSLTSNSPLKIKAAATALGLPPHTSCAGAYNLAAVASVKAVSAVRHALFHAGARWLIA